MTNSPNQPNDLPLYVTPPPVPARLRAVADKVGETVRCGLLILFWGLVAAAGLAASYVCLRGIFWGVRVIQTALGMP